MSTKLSRTRAVHYSIRAACVAVIGVCAYILLTQVNFTAITDNLAAAGYVPSETMSTLIRKIKLTREGRRIIMASKPELLDADRFNESCQTKRDTNYFTLGCYDGTIYVYNIVNTDLTGIRESTLAHELLHAVWSRMTVAERRELQEDLRAVYDGSEKLKKQIALYEDESKYNELHSVVGTQLAPTDLPDHLRVHYEKYFEEPSVLFAFYSGYSNLLESLRARVEELAVSIDKKKNQLAEMEEKYTAKNEKYINRYNEYVARSYSTTNPFTSLEAAQVEYDAIVALQAELIQDCDKINKFVAEINKEIYEFNETNKTTAQYQSIMNSQSVEKPSNPKKAAD